MLPVWHRALSAHLAPCVLSTTDCVIGMGLVLCCGVCVLVTSSGFPLATVLHEVHNCMVTDLLAPCRVLSSC